MEKFIKKIFWIPFIFGFIGYYIFEEISFWDSVYASLTLYFINPVIEENNSLIMIAKFSSIVLITGVILSLFRAIHTSFNQTYKNFYQDSTAIYSDDELGNILERQSKHGYISRKDKKNRIEKSKNHIIMYSEDLKNINFYLKNERLLKDSQVYIQLNEVDPYLLGAIEDENVQFYNLYEIMSRNYWRNNNLMEEKNYNNIKIAIVGFGNMGKAIFKYAYLNNIYSKKQKIEYHIWGCSSVDKEFLENLHFSNSDLIIIHTIDFIEGIKYTEKMDRIIIANQSDSHNLRIIQQLLYKNIDAEIHCYTDELLELSKIFNTNKVQSFGYVDEILNEDTIKETDITYIGKLLNYDYYLRSKQLSVKDGYEVEMERLWKQLTGFKKGSSVARADYYWHLNRLKKKERLSSVQGEWELEHIRWCRFHYYNRWSFASIRNDEKRQHNLLINYEELSTREKKKDGIYSLEIKSIINKLYNN